MNSEKQKLLIEYMLSSPDIFSKTSSMVKGEYFDPAYTATLNYIITYYGEYHSLPPVELIKAETGMALALREVTFDVIEKTIDDLEKFCQQKALELAVVESFDDIKAGNGGALKERIETALRVGLQRDLGLRYFEDPEARLQAMMHDSPVIPTGYRDLDAALFGGYSRKEMLLVSANSGGGKSITLSNLGFNALERGYNVLYISLELAENIVAQRYDTMFTGISRRDWKSNVNAIVTGLQMKSEDPNMGVLDIVQLPSGTKAMDIRSYIDRYGMYYKTIPDVVVLDYLDKMSPNQGATSGVWEKDKYCSEQLRDLGVEFNMAMLTASQLNREAIKAGVHDHSHIAGGISKINESDIYWSILMTEDMKMQGQCDFKLQKTRNSDGVGKVIHLKWDNKYLRILDGDPEGTLNYASRAKPSRTNLDGFAEPPAGSGESDESLEDMMSAIQRLKNPL